MNSQKNPLQIEITRSQANKNYYWHAMRSGRIVACGAEGYRSKQGLLKSLNMFLLSLSKLQYKLVDTTRKW